MDSSQLKNFLKHYYGYSDFKRGQSEIIENLLEGKSTLGILPTGTGKSLCYQLTGKILKKTVIVISPLLSLMHDQIEQLKYAGEKKVIALTSELSFVDKQMILANISDYSFIYLSPEMLKNDLVEKKLAMLSIGLLVVDEAHCISQWGPDFRPDYLRIKKFRHLLHNPLTLALTATATNNVAQDIQHNLFSNDEKKFVVRRSVDRPNIFLGVHETISNYEKNTYLIDIVKKLKSPGIIYFSSKKQANKISELLKAETSLRIAPYHAALSSRNRYMTQHQFMENQLDIICATSAFGMGINKKDVRFVIHYHLPSDLESYVQEIGRAGRNGERSLAILLYTKADINLQEQLSINSLPDDFDIENFQPKGTVANVSDKENVLQYYFEQGIPTSEIKQIFLKRRQEKYNKLMYLLEYIETPSCKRKFLLQYFDEEMQTKHGVDCCQLKGEPINIDYFKCEKEKKEQIINQVSDYEDILDIFFKTL